MTLIPVSTEEQEGLADEWAGANEEARNLRRAREVEIVPAGTEERGRDTVSRCVDIMLCLVNFDDIEDAEEPEKPRLYLLEVETCER